MPAAFSRWFRRDREHREQSLRRKIAAATVLVAILMAMFITITQLTLYYRQDVQDLHSRRMDVIVDSFLDMIRLNVWEYDRGELQLILNGLLQVPDIIYAKITLTDGETLSQGTPQASDENLVYRFPLYWESGGADIYIGELEVESTLSVIRGRLIRDVQQSILASLTIAAAIAICILLVVQRLITRHLYDIAYYARHLNLDRLHIPLRLKRKPHSRKDEMDYVVEAFNYMRQSLLAEFKQKSEMNALMARKQQELQAILDYSPTIIYLKDTQGHFLMANAAFGTIMKRPPESILGKTDWDIFIPEAARVIHENDAKVLAECRPMEFEEVIPLDNRERIFMATKFPLLDSEGNSWGIGGIVTEITARKESEKALATSEARLKALVQSLDDAVLEFDEQGICLRVWNARWPIHSKTVGQNLAEIFGAHVSDELIQLVHQVLTTGISRNLEFLHHKLPSCWISIRISAVEHPQRQDRTVCILCRDITEQKAAEERLQRMAHYDALTGLPNRSFLYEHLQTLLAGASRRNSQLAVLFIDLDRLKMVNDSLGHAVGDLLIKAAATRIKDCVREGDTVVRQGGDEFIVALPDLTQPHLATRIADKILKSLTLPFLLGSHELALTASIGISYFPKDGQEAELLIKNADAAMYAAKESGRNNYQVFSPDMSVDVSRRLSVQHGLRRALDRDQFRLYYQPQVDIRTGKVVGAEALIRWYHPKLGRVSPASFIPVAEDTGLILPIGTWALQEACRQYKEWQDEGLPPFVLAVNLSSLQFRQKNIVEFVQATLDELGMAPGNLELELTESTVMAHTEASISTLQTLKAMGLKLAIDDFGTGYSSLSYLKRFPVDKLKIDQSFIRDIDHDPEDAAIAAAIIALAKTLGLEVIAEGVQSMEAFQFLKAHQCDQIQGYLASRPLAADEFARLLTNEKQLVPEPA